MQFQDITYKRPGMPWSRRSREARREKNGRSFFFTRFMIESIEEDPRIMIEKRGREI